MDIMTGLDHVKYYCKQNVSNNKRVLKIKGEKLIWRQEKFTNLEAGYTIYLHYYKQGEKQYINRYRICIIFDEVDRYKAKDYVNKNQNELKKYVKANFFHDKLVQEKGGNSAFPVALYKPKSEPLEEWAYTNFLGCDKIIEMIDNHFKGNDIQQDNIKKIVTDVDYSETKVNIPVDEWKKEQDKRKVKSFDENNFIELAKKYKEKNIKEKTTTVKQYSRSIVVGEFARRMANGICQLCGENAPFLNKEGEPFLEVHHIKELANSGSDSFDNVIALCPNCHRKIHILHNEEDIEFLTDLAQTYYEKLC